MSAGLEELKTLWGKALEDQASRAEMDRLAELMSDSNLMQEFADWQASQAAGEPEASLDESQWRAIDAKVRRGYRRFSHPIKFKPLAWLAAAGLAAVMAWSFTTSESRKSADYEERSAELEMEEEEAALPAPKPRKAAGERELKAGRMRVILEQPKPGKASVKVYDSEGSLVRSLYEGRLDAGKYSFEWAGEDAQGRRVAPGRYSIESKTSAGSTTREVEIRSKK